MDELNLDLLSNEFLDDLLFENQAELELANAIGKYLETNTIEELEDNTGLDIARIMKFLSLEGNPTLGEMRNIAKAIGKRLVLEFK